MCLDEQKENRGGQGVSESVCTSHSHELTALSLSGRGTMVASASSKVTAQYAFTRVTAPNPVGIKSYCLVCIHNSYCSVSIHKSYCSVCTHKSDLVTAQYTFTRVTAHKSYCSVGVTALYAFTRVTVLAFLVHQPVLI